MNKRVVFVSGKVEKEIKCWPETIREAVFDEVAELCQGNWPLEYELVKSVKGAREKIYEFKIKTTDGDSATYRVFYVIAFSEAVYLLHAVKKKSTKIRTEDIETLKARYKTMIQLHESAKGS